MIKKPKLKLVSDNTEHVSSVINGVVYKIPEALEKELIDKSEQYKKSIKDNLELNKPLPRNYLYFLWVNIYKDSEYDYFLNPVSYMIADSKWKLIFNKWRSKWKRKLLSFLQH